MLHHTPAGDDSTHQNTRYDHVWLSNIAQIKLLKNPNFLLLYVPDDGSKMKIVKPAIDQYHRKRIMERSINEGLDELSLPHYALSHLWGISEENRHLWHEIGDYVDDEKGQPAAVVSMRPEKRETLLELLAHHPDSYWWIDVLCARTDTPLDIMGDIYNSCRTCYAMMDCDSHCISDLQSLVPCKDKSLKTVDEFWHAVDVWDTLAQCAWWKRVWTWQEMVLPKQVLLIAETDTQVCNTIDIDLFRDFMDVFRSFIYEEDIPEPMITRLVEAYNQFTDDSSASLSRIEEIKNCLDQRSIHQEKIDPPISAIGTFQKSSRRCMNPEDYVYGVLGVFKFQLPRGIESSELWQLFVSQVEDALKGDSNYYHVSPNAREFDLLTARDMAHVYQALLKFHGHVMRSIGSNNYDE